MYTAQQVENAYRAGIADGECQERHRQTENLRRMRRLQVEARKTTKVMRRHDETRVGATS
jgi:hypothetical protein